MLKKGYRCPIVWGAFFLSAVFMWGCGDGKTCDCCTQKKDCEFGLQCVDLIGGTGKVCGSQGINYCSADACTSGKKSSLFDGQGNPASQTCKGTYAYVEA